LNNPLEARSALDPLTDRPIGTKAWTTALKRAGIDDFRWHDLRHTFATWHRQAGTPIYELQRLGGWKTSSMVERYAHVAPEALQRQQDAGPR
jgi:integrase